MSWHRDGSHCDRPAECTALADRRQRARESFWDATFDVGAREAAEVAIETATRVKITADVIDAASDEFPWWTHDSKNDMREPLIAAFRAAGFEVEE